MSTNAVNVAVVDGKTISEATELRVAKSGEPVRIKAVTNGKYVLAEGDKGVAPENITVKRVGKDLHVALEGTNPDQPQLIIEGFYDTQGQLVGMAEDGSFHEYVASNALQDHSAAFLIEDVAAPQVLATESMASMSGGLVSAGGMSWVGGMGWVGAGLMGLAGIGLLGAAYAMTNNDDEKDDSPPLSTPNVSDITDDVGNKTGPIKNGDSTDDTTPTFNGTGNPGNIIIIRDGDKIIGEAVVGADGTWSFTPSTPMGAGAHSITFTEKNPLGIESTPSTSVDFTIDLAAPGKVAINEVLDDVAGSQGPLAQNSVTNDSTPTLSGQAEPGSTVDIYANGVKIGEAPVDANGNWVFTPSPALADGTYEFSVVAVDAAGNSGLASDPFVLTIDASAPGKPGEGGLGGIDSVIDDVNLVTGPIANGGLTNDSTPTLSGGNQQPGDIVNILNNGVVIGTATVKSDGTWSYTPGQPLADDTYNFSMSVTDAAGNTSPPSDPYAIIVDSLAPGKPGAGGLGGIDSVIDDVNLGTGPIANGGITNDNTPTFSGSNQTPGDTVTISDSNGMIIGTAVVQPDGSWSVSTTTPLVDGTYDIIMVVNDPAGNASLPSDPHTITVETAAPLAQAIVESMDKDAGASDFLTNNGSAGRLIEGSLTSALIAGEKVQVSTDGGTTWFDALLNADGTWSFLDLTAHTGDWTIQTRVVDAAGNFTTSSQDVFLDTVGPSAPTSLDFNGSVVTVNFDGNGLEVGDKVQIVVGDQRFEVELTQAQIDAGSVDVTTVAGAAMTNSEALIIDAAGNASQHLMPELETVDFEAVPVGGVPAGGTQNFGGFTFDWGGAPTDTSHGVLAAGVSFSGITTPSRGLGFTTTASAGNPTITLNNGVEAGAMSFLVGQATRPITLNFYDAIGGLVHTVALPPVPAGFQEVNFQLPNGLTFTTVEFAGTDSDWLWVDDFKFSNGSFNYMDPPATQEIDGTGAYYGDDVDNVFTVSDTAHLNDASSVINGEAGVDTLSLTGAGQVLNLDSIAGKLESIEVIDITGTGNNTLNLSLGDVLAQGETSLFVDDGHVQMMIKGNAGDVVNLDDLLSGTNDPGDWSAQGNVTVGGVVYDVYSHSSVDAELLVQQGVTTNLV